MIEENNTQKCDKHLHENESLEKLKTSTILYAPNYIQSSQKEIVINNNSAFSCHYFFFYKTSIDFSRSSASRMWPRKFIVCNSETKDLEHQENLLPLFIYTVLYHKGRAGTHSK